MSLRHIFLISLVILLEYSYLIEPISEKEYFKKNLKIVKITGDFKEGKIKQRVFILFNTKKMPQFEGISSFVIKKKILNMILFMNLKLNVFNQILYQMI